MRQATREELEECLDVEVIETPDPDTDRQGWLECRRQGIGGSDVAGIMGLSPWASPFHVWADKLGLGGPDDTNLAMELGTELEPFVLRKFEEETSLEVVTVKGFMFRDPERPWAIANPDALVLDRGELLGIPEAKTSSNYKHWEDGPPIWYQCQGQHYAGVLRCESLLYFPVLKFAPWGPDFDIPILRPNPRDIEAIRARCGEFWKVCVEGETPPPIMTGSGAREALAKYLEQLDKDVQLDADQAALVDALEEAKAQRDAASDEADKLQAQLMEVIGEARRGITPDGRKATVIQRRYFDEKAALEEDADLVESHQKTKVDTKALKRSEPEFYDRHMKVSSAYIRIYD